MKKALVRLSALSLLLMPLRLAAQSLNCPQGIGFGEIIPCGVAGTITVKPDDSTTTGGCVTIGAVPTSKALCTFHQAPSMMRQVQITLNTPEIEISSGNAQMRVDHFNVMTNNGGTQHQLPTAADVKIPIGATLNVGATQASGSYSGTMGITATFE